jgi:simple sugar transport system ATP-binding protein
MRVDADVSVTSPPSAQGGPEPAVIELRGITKRFGPVVANDNVSISIRAGEVLAVLGENGAGKTTLMNVVAGMTRPDAGEIVIRGRPTVIDSPQDAITKGIGTVYQHFTLVPTLSVIENVVLGTDVGFRLDLAAAEGRLRERLGDFGVNVSPRGLVRHLAVGQRQRVEIVKVLYRNQKVLLLDEPTSVLTPVEVEELFPILRRLRQDGVAVVLITHKLEEALEVSDRIVVLRAGRKVGELGPEALGEDRAAVKAKIVDLMFGGSAAAAEPPTRVGDRGAGPVILSLQGVSAKDDRGATAVRDFSLDLHAGEVFGIAGVDGNGQKELGEVIAGQRPAASGRVVFSGKDLTGKGVRAAARAGIGYVTDDRLGEGCVGTGSVAFNAVLKQIDQRPFSRRWLVDRRAIDRHAQELIQRFDVRTPSVETPIERLSGGNIQKLLLARELAADPILLVCNKPTNGLDVRTARFVLDTLRAQADAGRAVLLISSELEELFAVSDRIGVIYRGRLVGVFDRDSADVETIGHHMLGGVAVDQGAA